MSSLAWSGTFTNHAGRTISGRLSAISNGMAVVSGRAYPLSVFPESEQRRMLALLSVPEPLPPRLEALRRSLRERALRAEALAAAGAGADAEAKRAKLQSAWARALDADVGISPATRRHWLTRMMDP